MTGQIADPATFAATLNKELKEAKLLCQGDGCGVENNLGFLDEISLESKESPGWLILKTAVGINCKVDYSIYVYEMRGCQWTQTIADRADRLRRGQIPAPISKLGSLSAGLRRESLASNGWKHSCLYVRLAHGIRSPVSHSVSKLLQLRNWEGTFNTQEKIGHRLEPDGAVIEFGSNGLVTGDVRRHVLRFKIDGNKVRRIQPFALPPWDFVDEWRSREWSDIAEWSNPKLEEVHGKLHKDQPSRLNLPNSAGRGQA